MPSIADITVKANNGTTDVVYTAVQPSSGDGTPAIWQAQAGALTIAARPELRLSARDMDAGRKRMLRTTYVRPQVATNTTTSLTSVVNKAMASTNWTMPKDMTTTDINEFVQQYANLMVAALIASCVKSGYAAT